MGYLNQHLLREQSNVVLVPHSATVGLVTAVVLSASKAKMVAVAYGANFQNLDYEGCYNSSKGGSNGEKSKKSEKWPFVKYFERGESISECEKWRPPSRGLLVV